MIVLALWKMLRFREVKGLLPGVLSVAGAFLIQVGAHHVVSWVGISLMELLQLGVGSYHGTFGNLLPYFSSYMRQVSCYSYLQF